VSLAAASVGVGAFLAGVLERPYHRAMNAAALAIGTELLGAQRQDTNSLVLASLLERHGVRLRWKATVGDDAEEIAAEIRRLSTLADLVVVSGGLGPTDDDRTRQAAARAFERQLREDSELVLDLEAQFAKLGVPMPEVNRRQATVIEGCEVLHNSVGTAPGLLLEENEAAVFLLPGVPREYRHLLDEYLEPWLEKMAPGTLRISRTIRISCLPESLVEQRILPVYDEIERDAISILASPGDIRIRITANADRTEEIESAADRIEDLVGRAVFSRSEDGTLEGVVADLLTARGLRVATAESCTGGLVAQRLTSIPGSSTYFPGGVVAYSDTEKTRLLGVDAAILEECGAVSEEVARALASGAQQRFASDFGIGITGVAGPGGGTEAKPVGTVHLALAGPAVGELVHRQLRLPGDRDRIRWYSSQVALEMLRRRLLESRSD
jgi:nicotinamide-nucleotide amidase